MRQRENNNLGPLMNFQVEHHDTSSGPKPGVPFWRRLLAIVYDTFVLICVIFVAWQPVPLLPLDLLPPPVSQGLRLLYLLSITFLFFGWFWTHGGQTIGMRAWQIKLESSSTSTSPGWKQCWIRYLIAMLSWLVLFLGFLWALFHPQRAAWHDLVSGTRLVNAPRKQ
jgi:uncharacterized RDD family membrane protein YckC